MHCGFRDNFLKQLRQVDVCAIYLMNYYLITDLFIMSNAVHCGDLNILTKVFLSEIWCLCFDTLW